MCFIAEKMLEKQSKIFEFQVLHLCGLLEFNVENDTWIIIIFFSAIHFLGNQTVNSFVSVLIVLLWSSSRFYEARTRSVRLSPCQWVQF